MIRDDMIILFTIKIVIANWIFFAIFHELYQRGCVITSICLSVSNFTQKLLIRSS